MKHLCRYRYYEGSGFNSNVCLISLQKAFPEGNVLLNRHKSAFSPLFYYEINSTTVLSLYNYVKEVIYK